MKEARGHVSIMRHDLDIHIVETTGWDSGKTEERRRKKKRYFQNKMLN